MTVLRTVLSLFTDEERRQVYLLLPLMIVMALFEVAGVASIAPFLTLLANPSAASAGGALGALRGLLPSVNDHEFTLIVGSGALLTLFVTNGLSALTFYRLYRFGAHRNHSLSKRLLERYLHQPYEFFLTRNTSGLANNILQEVQQVVDRLIVPGMQMLAKGLAAIFIVGMLVAVRPALAVLTAALLGGAYTGVFAVIRRRLGRIGKERVRANAGRFKAANEGLGSIKEVKLLGREDAYVHRYDVPAARFADVQAENQILGMLPRYALETVAFGGVLIVVLVLLASGASSSSALPLIGLYAFAGYRLLPALQTVFQGLSSVRYSTGALAAVTEMMARTDTDGAAGGSSGLTRTNGTIPRLQEGIVLRAVHYRYPGASRDALRGLDVEIPAGTRVGLVGATGSGKTTFADIVLGLLLPSSGTIEIDGVPLTERNVREWYEQLGYVPQSIFLADDTVATNIALGVPQDSVDMERVRRAARIARIEEFVDSQLPDGFDTVIGERGARLSGGQRQRIGVARALYHDATVLVLDEATSALDVETERSLFDHLIGEAGHKTIIMITHRLATVQSCDEILVLDEGRLEARGAFASLVETSSRFGNLVGGVLAK